MQLYGVPLQHLLSMGISRTLLVGGVITSNRAPQDLGLNVPVEGDMAAFVLPLPLDPQRQLTAAVE